MGTTDRPPRLCFTRHAQLRRKQMGLTERQVERAVAEPDLTYSSVWKGVLRRLFQRGPIVVVMGRDERDVVTVLWHGKDGRAPETEVMTTTYEFVPVSKNTAEINRVSAD